MTYPQHSSHIVNLPGVSLPEPPVWLTHMHSLQISDCSQASKMCCMGSLLKPVCHLFYYTDQNLDIFFDMEFLGLFLTRESSGPQTTGNAGTIVGSREWRKCGSVSCISFFHLRSKNPVFYFCWKKLIALFHRCTNKEHPQIQLTGHLISVWLKALVMPFICLYTHFLMCLSPMCSRLQCMHSCSLTLLLLCISKLELFEHLFLCICFLCVCVRLHACL